jgi:para-nitrobenzyl esterase
MIGATSGDMGGRTGFMIGGARKVAGMVAAKGVPVYAYRFSYVAESQPASAGAGHASDIPFFFDNAAIKYGAQTSPRDMAMGKAISTYIVNFARTGNPNGAGLPAWPLYDRAGDRIMDFAPSGTLVPEKDPWGGAKSTRPLPAADGTLTYGE